MEDLKIYTAKDIQNILKISRSNVYKFLENVYKNTHEFKIIKIGKLYRIPKNSFEKWLCENGIEVNKNEKRNE